MAQKKLIEGAEEISGKVEAKATAPKPKAAHGTGKEGIADIAEQVAAKLAESGAQKAQHAPEGSSAGGSRTLTPESTTRC